jgi:Type II secretory pathway, component PulD
VILTTGTDTSSVQTLQMIKGGIFLKILPKVIDNSEGGNDIALNISSEVSDVTIGTEKMPTALRRVVSTNVRIKDGQTVVIGGLKQETERETVEKVPILGDIPIIGAFFSSKKTVKDMSDILVFITCKVVNELEAPKE